MVGWILKTSDYKYLFPVSSVARSSLVTESIMSKTLSTESYVIGVMDLIMMFNCLNHVLKIHMILQGLEPCYERGAVFFVYALVAGGGI